ncbi:MAG TPA: prolipoprotein diacylglyceryl transferase family protein [Solirubrobacterales bacterium]|jgi:phosphatidylglycerol:prolipoprotein diacylglycerol transferase|nr:prolipoprotein diacylglyceryl transferase family protein [Solirubrobacterales bacterium]
MLPEIDLGPLTIQTFGLMFALAFVVSGLIVGARLREFDAPVDWAYELVLAAGVGGLIGAKLWFALQENDWSMSQLFSGSGLVWYGGALGGAAAVSLYARWRGILNLTMLDVTAPALAAGYAVGRIGCQLSGDGDYGKESDAWWAMGYPDGTVPTPPGVTVYPTPVLEVISMSIVAAVLWRWRNRWRPGVLFGIYLVASGIERFAIEFLRRNEEIALGMTLAQYVSIAMVIGGVALVVVLKDRPHERRELLASAS